MPRTAPPPPSDPQTVAPDPATGGAAGRRRRRDPVGPAGGPRFRLRYLWLLLLLWLVYLVAVPVVAWNKVDKVGLRARAATGRPTSPARRTSWSAATRAQGLSKERAQGARHRQRRRRPHRHDHAAAHRLRPEPAALHPARLDRRHPGPRRPRKINAAYAFGGPELLIRDRRAEHRHPGRRLRRDRHGRRRRHRRRGRRHRGLPEGEHEGQARRAWTSRRAARRSTARPRWPTRGRGTPPASATSTGSAGSARWSPRSARRCSRRGPWSTRCAGGG